MYNVEPYVERCIRSLEDQDLPKEDYEIICINDGSPDKSREIVRSLQREFDNIVLIDQDNQGVSIARNNGINKAKGNYLLMVDPDDYIKHDVFKARLDLLEQNNLDIGITGFIILGERGNEEYRYDPLYDKSKVFSGIEYYNYFRIRNNNIEKRDPHRTVAIFFRREFLFQHNLSYLADVPYLEDGELLARAVCLAKRVMFFNTPFYLRTTRPGSATHSNLYYSEKARNGFLKAATNLHQFKIDICRKKEQKEFLNTYIVHFTCLYIKSFRVSEYFKKYSILVNILKTGPLKRLDTSGCSKSYKKMAGHYNRSIHCFYINYIIHRISMSLKIKVRKLFSI